MITACQAMSLGDGIFSAAAFVGSLGFGAFLLWLSVR